MFIFIIKLPAHSATSVALPQENYQKYIEITIKQPESKQIKPHFS